MPKSVLSKSLLANFLCIYTSFSYAASPTIVPSGDTSTPALFGSAKIIKQLTPEQRLERLEAYDAVSNVMGRYSYLHTAGRHTESESLFALNTPGVRVEMMWGVYEGAKSIHRLYSSMHVENEGVNERKGQLHLHTLTTPVIEVAGDLKTAKAVWDLLSTSITGVVKVKTFICPLPSLTRSGFAISCVYKRRMLSAPS